MNKENCPSNGEKKAERTEECPYFTQAILILPKMPTNCASCDRFYGTDAFHGGCRENAEIQGILSADYADKRHESCPIRPMPEKMVVDQDNVYEVITDTPFSYGWNACLDAIEGEKHE